MKMVSLKTLIKMPTLVIFPLMMKTKTLIKIIGAKTMPNVRIVITK